MAGCPVFRCEGPRIAEKRTDPNFLWMAGGHPPRLGSFIGEVLCVASAEIEAVGAPGGQWFGKIGGAALTCAAIWMIALISR